MRKIILILLTILLLIVGCDSNNVESGESGSNENYAPNDISNLNLSVLDKFVIELSDATDLGIVDKTSVSKANVKKAINSGNSFILAQKDGAGNISEVEFVATEKVSIGNRTVNAGDSLSLNSLYAQADKLFVGKDFTLISISLCVDPDDSRIVSKGKSTIVDPTIVPEVFIYEPGVREVYENCTFVEPASQEIEYIVWAVKGDDSEETKTVKLWIRPENSVATAYSGISIFDSYGYCSNELRQSFVLHNSTGKLYRIEDVELTIMNGIPCINSSPVRFVINGDGNLEVKKIVPNPEVVVYNFFEDNYGQVFVFTKSNVPEQTNTDLKVHYYNTYNKYKKAADGYVYEFYLPSSEIYNYNFILSNNTRGDESIIPEVYRIQDEFSKTAISESETIYFNCFWGAFYWRTCTFFDKIQDGKFYMRGVPFFRYSGQISPNSFSGIVVFEKSDKQSTDNGLRLTLYDGYLPYYGEGILLLSPSSSLHIVKDGTLSGIYVNQNIFDTSQCFCMYNKETNHEFTSYDWYWYTNTSSISDAVLAESYYRAEEIRYYFIGGIEEGNDLLYPYAHYEYLDNNYKDCSYVSNSLQKILDANYDSIEYVPKSDGTALVRVRFQDLSESKSYDIFDNGNGIEVRETNSYTIPDTPVAVFQSWN